MYASKRSANNWGVTGPSQIRYVEYFSRILHKEIVPLSVPYFLECITISAMPIGGCFPFIHIYQFEQQGGKKLIYSSETPELKFYIFFFWKFNQIFHFKMGSWRTAICFSNKSIYN